MGFYCKPKRNAPKTTQKNEIIKISDAHFVELIEWIKTTVWLSRSHFLLDSDNFFLEIRNFVGLKIATKLKL